MLMLCNIIVFDMVPNINTLFIVFDVIVVHSIPIPKNALLLYIVRIQKWQNNIPVICCNIFILYPTFSTGRLLCACSKISILLAPLLLL